MIKASYLLYRSVLLALQARQMAGMANEWAIR